MVLQCLQHPSHGLSLTLAFKLRAFAPEIPINRAVINTREFKAVVLIGFDTILFSIFLKFRNDGCHFL
jgi:hypothetical protein